MLRRLTLFIMTGLVVLLGVAVEAQALVPLMPQDHPLCREVLQREKRDYEYGRYFGRDGLELAYRGGITFEDLTLDGRCKGFIKGLHASSFQVYKVPFNSEQYYIFVSEAYAVSPFVDDSYAEHKLYVINDQTCHVQQLDNLALPVQTPVPYFMSYAVYQGETYGIYTARHEKVNEEIEGWILDYEGQKIIQNLSRADGKTMVCRH